MNVSNTKRKLQLFWHKNVQKIAVGHSYAELFATRVKANGEVTDFGLVGIKKITTAFVNDIVDAMQGGGTLGLYKYHGSGTDNTAENVADSELGAIVGSSYTAGSQEEGATANVYKSIATISYTSTKTIIEHLIANSATVESATVCDRTVLGAGISVDNGDSIIFTYQLTFTAGG